jgi:coproporphyrinogen III oxidase
MLNPVFKNTAEPLQPSQAQKEAGAIWFAELRDKICAAFEAIEHDFAAGQNPATFTRKAWDRSTPDGLPGGGGVMSLMKGNVFEKVGVNVSTVYGHFSPEFRAQIPGAEKDGIFWASGISLVAHPKNPKVPAVHMNTRHIVTSKGWFGGGADLTPSCPFEADTAAFHARLKQACDAHGSDYYEHYRKWCDEYFFIRHRNEPRGVGGVFYDYHNSGNWDADFAFTRDVGLAFLDVYPKLVRGRMNEAFDETDKKAQLVKRGRYAEFNLVYDRGTRFGLMTGGNIEAILMSLPPEAAWD